MSVETQFQIFVEAGALPGRPKKAKIAHMSTPENVIDLVSTPPPPSPTKVTEEQVLEQHLVSPLNLWKSTMSEAVKTDICRNSLRKFLRYSHQHRSYPQNHLSSRSVDTNQDIKPSPEPLQLSLQLSREIPTRKLNWLHVGPQLSLWLHPNPTY